MSRLSTISWYVLTFAVIAALGALNLNMPFVADQAVALLAAKNLEHGGVLYVDFWDNKMPALFWFYWLGGKLFSFDELGIHLLELGWMLAFAGTIAFTLRSYFYHSWVSSIAALAVVGFYYASALENQLTLPEPLVTFPLFLCAWFTQCCVNDVLTKKSLLYATMAGISAGIAVTFKLVLAPICIAFWIIASIYLLRLGKHRLATLTKQFWTPLLIGGSIFCSLIVAVFWANGALDEFIWTAFIYPPQALKIAPQADLTRLFTTVMFGVSSYAIWFIPFICALIWWLKKDRDSFTALLITWVVVGLVVIFIQSFSWWTYHLYLVFAPIALLGVRGLDVLTKYICQHDNAFLKPPIVTLALSIFVFSALGMLAGPKISPAVSMLLLNDKSVNEYRRYIRPEYGQIYKSAQFLNNKKALPGDITVFGNPLYYIFSNRSPALTTVGWPWGYFLQSQWLELPNEIMERAPVYIFIDEKNQRLMDIRQGGVKELIYSRYLAASRAHDGTWFQLKKEFIN